MGKKQKNTKINRSVWITGAIDSEEKIEKIIRKIVNFDKADSTKPICIFINSRGGQFHLMVKLRKFLLKNVTSPLITIGLVDVQSAACSLMPCGHLRILVKGTKFLFHQASVNLAGPEPVRFNAMELIEEAMSLKKSTDIALGYCIKQRPEHKNPCNIDVQSLLGLIESAPGGDLVIGDKKAIKMGLADCIVKKVSEIKKVQKKFARKFKQKKRKK